MNYLLKFKIKHWNNSTSLLCGPNFLSVFFSKFCLSFESKDSYLSRNRRYFCYQAKKTHDKVSKKIPSARTKLKIVNQKACL